jgi:hypothetical protein
MPSTIGPARAALFAMLDEAPGLLGSLVSFGKPSEGGTDVVALLGLREPEERAAVVNGDLRRESYVIEVGILVQDVDAKTPLEVEARALELAEEVRQVVMGDKTLRATVDTAFPVGVTSPTLELTGPAIGGGWVSLPMVLIGCTAWIT